MKFKIVAHQFAGRWQAELLVVEIPGELELGGSPGSRAHEGGLLSWQQVLVLFRNPDGSRRNWNRKIKNSASKHPVNFKIIYNRDTLPLAHTRLSDNWITQINTNSKALKLQVVFIRESNNGASRIGAHYLPTHITRHYPPFRDSDSLRLLTNGNC